VDHRFECIHDYFYRHLKQRTEDQRMRSSLVRRLWLRVEELEPRTLLSVGVVAQPLTVATPCDWANPPTASPPYTPAEMRHAYGFDQITFNNGTIAGDGSGQTIAIVVAYFDQTIVSDLATFDAKFGLPDPKLIRAYATTQPPPSSNWNIETALDVEWAHAIAPGANILLVEAASNSSTDLFTGVNFARQQPGVSVVSMSWAFPETSGEASGDATFTTPPGHNGVTFVASTGDTGVTGGPPSTSPNVLAVGGTTLTISDGPGTYGSETAWPSSSGGPSLYEPEPAFQQILPGISGLTGGKRGTPDVAYNADTTNAVYFFFTQLTGTANWFRVGGTSAGAPQWAGLVAIADQGRALAGASTLDGPSQTLYALYQMANTNYANYFHDITSGSNGAHSALTGYDLVTGLGSPIANQVVAGLVSWQGTGTGGSLAVAQPLAQLGTPALQQPGTNGVPPSPAAPVSALIAAVFPAQVSSALAMQPGINIVPVGLNAATPATATIALPAPPVQRAAESGGMDSATTPDVEAIENGLAPLPEVAGVPPLERPCADNLRTVALPIQEPTPAPSPVRVELLSGTLLGQPGHAGETLVPNEKRAALATWMVGPDHPLAWLAVIGLADFLAERGAVQRPMPARNDEDHVDGKCANKSPSSSS
jgi:hypothetical protein